jgi:hypothetical protein
MIILSRVKQATNEFIKVLRFGKSDVQTSKQFLPFGVDSKPIKESLAAQAVTSNSAETIVLGYKIESETTKEGEFRIFATDSEGAEVFSVHFKNDGTCEFGGNVDNFVRFLKLDQALQTFITDLNTKLVGAFGGVGGSWPGTSLNISAAKIEEVKTL